MSSEIISQLLSTLKQTSKLSNINRKRAAVIGILKQTIPLWHPYLRMSFYGKLPFSFKYSESPRKDTMLQNILQTSPATPWKASLQLKRSLWSSPNTFSLAQRIPLPPAVPFSHQPQAFPLKNIFQRPDDTLCSAAASLHYSPMQLAAFPPKKNQTKAPPLKAPCHLPLLRDISFLSRICPSDNSCSHLQHHYTLHAASNTS